MSLLIDLRRLRYFNEFWPACMGPCSNWDQERWPQLVDRWALVGVPAKVQVVMNLFSHPDRHVRVVDRCPADGSVLDLDGSVCAGCGELPLITWGPVGIAAIGRPGDRPETA